MDGNDWKNALAAALSPKAKVLAVNALGWYPPTQEGKSSWSPLGFQTAGPGSRRGQELPNHTLQNGC